jgi:dihydropteroate synthase
VAKQALDAGASIVNDVSAGDDDEQMFDLIAKRNVPYIIMHKKGNPQTMQNNPIYEDVVLEVLDYLALKVQKLKALGVKDIIIDPGFGFGKDIHHNYQLLKQLNDFKIIGVPILVGVSRKKMIQKVIDVEATEALNGTTVLNTMALLNGANIIRVHDVKEATECIKLVNKVYGII